MKLKPNKRAMKTNFFCGLILLSTGILLELSAGFETIFDRRNSGLNLNLVEINKVYDQGENNTTEVTQLSYQGDTSWGWPTSGHYYLTSYYSGYHPAIDIVTTDGDRNIYAASSGYIVTNSYKWDGGNYIILKQDNGYYTLYCHLATRAPVSEGQRIEKGQVIGTMGMTGYATGVHLHYSVWNGYPYYGSSSINPLNFY